MVYYRSVTRVEPEENLPHQADPGSTLVMEEMLVVSHTLILLIWRLPASVENWAMQSKCNEYSMLQGESRSDIMMSLPLGARAVHYSSDNY